MKLTKQIYNLGTFEVECLTDECGVYFEYSTWDDKLDLETIERFCKYFGSRDLTIETKCNEVYDMYEYTFIIKILNTKEPKDWGNE